MADRDPAANELKRLFRRLPMWVVILILVLLYGRLVMVAVWHWVSG